MTKFKVGDRVRRTQNQHQGMKPGNIGTIIEIDNSDSDDPDFWLKEYNEGKGRHNCATGGFELVEQTYTKLTPKVGDKFRVVKQYGGTNPEEFNKTKLTTMQKLTSALKRVLSADKQTLYKAGVIGQDLTLTGNGRAEYTSALFDNEGDHKKAVAQMVEDAQEYLDEEKN